MYTCVLPARAAQVKSSASTLSHLYWSSLLTSTPGRPSLTAMAQQKMEKKPFERLPLDVVPINYKLELKPDLNAFTFQGKLEITVKVLICVYEFCLVYVVFVTGVVLSVLQVSKVTRMVVMNCADIDIQSAKCAQGDLSESGGGGGPVSILGGRGGVSYILCYRESECIVHVLYRNSGVH